MLVSEKVGPYTVIDRRQEGTSVLCLASNPHNGHHVLVRLLRLAAADEEARARVVGEMQALAIVQHRNLVEVVDVVDEPDAVGLVTEVLDGETLDGVASAAPLDLRVALDVSAQVCAGLHFAHTFGLAHGRLRGDQVCLTAGGAARVLNVGIALIDRLADDPACPMADLDRTSDEWRLADMRGIGAVLYHALTGHEPPAPGLARTTLLARCQSSAASRDASGEVTTTLANLIELLLDTERDPRSRVPDLAALGRALTAARLALDEPPTPAALEQGSSADRASDDRGTRDRPLEVADVPPASAPTGPAELGTAVVPLPPVRPTTRRARDVAVWASIGAVSVLAVAFVLWILPPTPPPPPQTWILSIDSDPQRAAVLIDGKPTGQFTPLDLTLPTERDPAIELTLDGYQAARVSVSATVRLNGRVRVSLQPLPPPPGQEKVAVVVRGSYAFEILQNGRVISPMASEHSLELRKDESIEVRSLEHYLDRSYRVPPEGLDFSVPPLAKVVVQAAAYENCAVAIGNQVTGRYPGGDALLVPVGSYQFGLRCGDGRRPRTRTATIRAVPLNQVDFAKEE